MHNPNVSQDAKEHSRQVLEDIQGSSGYSDKEESRVIGGYKATLKSKSPVT